MKYKKPSIEIIVLEDVATDGLTGASGSEGETTPYSEDELPY